MTDMKKHRDAHQQLNQRRLQKRLATYSAMAAAAVGWTSWEPRNSRTLPNTGW